jgi:CPA1 family monovalent cation:H+ antiporter
MRSIELIAGLLLAAVVLAAVARRARAPYPAVLVLGGLGLGFVPGLPQPELPPDVTFLVFVPPLVYRAAARFGLRDLRRHLWPILRLSVGLVLITLASVAAAAHGWVEGMAWPAALVLAAVVAPTDTAAVTAVTRDLPVPRRVAAILEGESLFNDVVALVAYQQAVRAAATGTSSAAQVGVALAWDAAAGVGVGLAVRAAAAWGRRLGDPALDTAASLLTPFAAYLGAEAAGGSGVLATVAAGLYVGRALLSTLGPAQRVQSFAFWDGAAFVLEGLAFVLIGFQLRPVTAGLAGYAVAVRLVWMLTRTVLPRVRRRPAVLPARAAVLHYLIRYRCACQPRAAAGLTTGEAGGGGTRWRSERWPARSPPGGCSGRCWAPPSRTWASCRRSWRRRTAAGSAPGCWPPCSAPCRRASWSPSRGSPSSCGMRTPPCRYSP